MTWRESALILNNREIIPELLQSECNASEIYKTVNYFLNKPELMIKQIKQVNKTIDEIKSDTPSAQNAATILSQSLVS